MAEVRICPTCGAENPPSIPKCCSCRRTLWNVGFTESKAVGTSPGQDDTVPDEEEKVEKRFCPFPDCAAELSQSDVEFCPYCSRSLNKEGASSSCASTISAFICWPWGEDTPLTDVLRIGREPPAPLTLMARLEREYGNVSRRHAELTIQNDTLTLRDLGSTNGTFVNDQRVAPNQPVTLADGDLLRFAAHLSVKIILKRGD